MTDLIDLARDIIDTDTPYKSNHRTFITYKNQIVAVGRNYEDRTHPIAKKFGYYDAVVHSELDALIKFSRKNFVLSRCIVWNVRIDRAKKVRCSRPCGRCQGLLKAFGAGRVLFTTDSGEFEAFVA